MRKIKLALCVLSLHLLFLPHVTAQGNPHTLDSVLSNYLTNQLTLNIRKFHDSANLYSFAIKITITRINSQSIRIDSISTNNPVTAQILFGDLQEIRKLKHFDPWNYKKLQIIKPVSILIGSSQLINPSKMCSFKIVDYSI
ncbi:hypothetical protein [Pedobacter endophyticus]|uniref:DUF3122 domain-containing protein n=1 Tax=Pedobacter endophyticus TaxID=2789740 RepID=A0A7S9L1U8_9SPHI|nr:hypothetical protein [Pedobacter endophyticus]QPH40586.1 hypothetical protein IZT61_04715 [Pedobacter endophyticus]